MKRILMSKTNAEVKESANQVRRELINQYTKRYINRDQYKRLMNRVTLMEDSANRRVDIMRAVESISFSSYDINHMIKIVCFQEDRLYQLNYEFTGLITSLDTQDQREVYDFAVQFDHEIITPLIGALIRIRKAKVQ